MKKILPLIALTLVTGLMACSSQTPASQTPSSTPAVINLLDKQKDACVKGLKADPSSPAAAKAEEICSCAIDKIKKAAVSNPALLTNEKQIEEEATKAGTDCATQALLGPAASTAPTASAN